jgi:hypothetical protein
LPDGPINWDVSTFSNETQIFESIESGKNCDLSIQLPDNDIITIEYYENNAVIPTKIKEFITK